MCQYNFYVFRSFRQKKRSVKSIISVGFERECGSGTEQKTSSNRCTRKFAKFLLNVGGKMMSKEFSVVALRKSE